MSLYFATQGLGRVLLTVTANGVRLLLSVGGGLLAVFWLGLGTPGFFASIAAGFIAYGAFNVFALAREKAPPETPIGGAPSAASPG